MRKRNPYDTIPYPSTSFPQTHPDRLAVIAGLHGLAAPGINAARVLEIGGGDGFNLLALATAWPKAHFRSFDLSAEAVERGRALAEVAGLENIRIDRADILDVSATIEPESYDYIIAHGVYAWVPAPVRAAIMALAGRALSPDGVFFVSYNAMPGGHVRQVMRDMLLHTLEGIVEIEDRIRAARAFLEAQVEPREGDDAVVTCIRAQSRSMLQRPDAVLFHDELGDCFAPQYLRDVVLSAGAHGLEFLNDSGRDRLDDGFAPDEGEGENAPPDTAALVRRAQADDFSAMRFFRQSLFVRSGRQIARAPCLDSLDACLIAGMFEPSGEGGIRIGETEFVLRDAGLTRRLLDLGAGWPRHRVVADIAHDADQREALFRLFKMGVCHLTTQPPPFAMSASERPVASPLVRAQLLAGLPTVTSLHLETMKIDDPAARAFIPLLDGSRDRNALTEPWAALPHDSSINVGQALQMLAGQRLLLR